MSSTVDFRPRWWQLRRRLRWWRASRRVERAFVGRKMIVNGEERTITKYRGSRPAAPGDHWSEPPR